MASQAPQPLGQAEPRDSHADAFAFRDDGPDPELLALPDPPKKERRLTMALLFLTALVAMAMAASLARDARYAVSAPERPTELADLRTIATSTFTHNSFVCAHGVLGAANAIRFERPFESDSYRLSAVAGREDVWVEVRVPAGAESARYVPPSSFCGRLMRMDASGLRHRGLSSAVEQATGKAVPAGAWLLVDGDDPEHSRWAVALVALFAAFALWNAVALVRLARPVRG